MCSIRAVCYPAVHATPDKPLTVCRAGITLPFAPRKHHAPAGRTKRAACTVWLFSQYWFSLVSHLPAVLLCALSSAVCPEGQNRQDHGPLRLPVRSGRVVEPNYARQLLAHPSGSAEPVGGFGLTLWSDG